MHLTSNTVLVPTSYCTVRQHENEHLVYNVKSDELHLISDAGLLVYQLCDGISNLSDIHGELRSRCTAAAGEIQEQLYNYVSQLISRGIVEIVEDA